MISLMELNYPFKKGENAPFTFQLSFPPEFWQSAFVSDFFLESQTSGIASSFLLSSSP